MSKLTERFVDLIVTYHLRRDTFIEDMTPLYADDLRYGDPFVELQGREAYLEMNRKLLRNVKSVRFADVALVGDEPHFMVSYHCTIEPKIGFPISGPGVSEVRSRDGLIVYQREHWDALRAILGNIPLVGTAYLKVTTSLFG